MFNNFQLFFNWFKKLFNALYLDFRQVYLFLKRRSIDSYYSTIRLFTEVLTTQEIYNFSIFLVIFLIFDRQTNKRVKYKKRLAPNYLWRFVALMVYYEPWLRYLHIYFQNLFLQGPFIGEYFGSAFQQLIGEWMEAWQMISFRHEIDLSQYWFYIFYGGFLIFVRMVPREIIRLPMFVRYHWVCGSMYQMFQEPIYQLYNWIVSYMPEIHRDLLEDTFTDSFGLRVMTGSPLEWNASIALFTLFMSTIGHSTLDAVCGKSFTNNLLVDVTKTHIGFSGLYKDEEWKDFGLDDRELIDDEFDEDEAEN